MWFAKFFCTSFVIIFVFMVIAWGVASMIEKKAK